MTGAAIGLTLLSLFTLPAQYGREYPPLPAPLLESLITYQIQVQDKTYHSGDWVLTAAAMDRLIILEGKDYPDRYALAAWFQWTTNDQRAQKYYQQMLAAHPDNADAWYELAQYYFINRRDFANAEKATRTAMALGLPAPQNHLLGFSLKKQHKEAEARAFWEYLLKMDPTDETAKRELGIE